MRTDTRAHTRTGAPSRERGSGPGPPALGRQVCVGVPGSQRGCGLLGHTVHSSPVGPARRERSSPQSSLCALAPAVAATLLRPLLSYRGSAAGPCLLSALARKVWGQAEGGGVTWASSLLDPPNS